MIQLREVNDVTSENPLFARWTELEKEVFRNLPKNAFRIYGSAVIQPKLAFNDIDIAVASDNTDLFARLLWQSRDTRFHPSYVPAERLEDLQNCMSWRNANMVITPNGERIYGKSYYPGKKLIFNPLSKTVFTNFYTVAHAATKMAEASQGVISIGIGELQRARLHLNNDLASLATLARYTLSDYAYEAIRKAGGIIAGGFLRDEITGRFAKDIDVFVPSNGKWAELCAGLSEVFEEVKFEIPPGKNVNLRKFRVKSPVHGHTNLVIDVIDYAFVSTKAHVVETFDFRFNMMWLDPATDAIHGPLNASANDVYEDIIQKRIVVGDNLWYRAGYKRAVRRWSRFREEGYTADAENIAKYKAYIRLFGANT